MELPRKAEWALDYPEPDGGGTKLVVGYDTTSKYLPSHVTVRTGSEDFYVDCADVPWLCARLLDAHARLTKEPTP